MSISARRLYGSPYIKRFKAGIPGITTFNASSSHATQVPARAMDGSTNDVDGWTAGSQTLPQWWQVQYASAWTPRYYEIWSRAGLWWRVPTSWTVSGSNDGTNWTTVDTRSGEVWSSAIPSRAYKIANPANFAFWRITLNTITSPTDTPGLQEVAFYTGNDPTYTPPTGIPTAPSQAIAAGYNNLTFNDDFDSMSTIDMTNSHADGFNWYRNLPFGWSENDSVITDHTSESYVELNMTTNHVQTTMATSCPTGDKGRGFFGGYFEAVMKWPPVTGSSVGFPAFWMMSRNHWDGNNSVEWGEIDWYEQYYASTFPERYITTMHDWPGTTGRSHVKTSSNSTVMSSVDWNTWHTFGGLWIPQNGSTPGRIAYYFDNTLVKEWTYSTTGVPSPAVSGATTGTFSVIDRMGEMTLILGTGKDVPLMVDRVSVWQS